MDLTLWHLRLIVVGMITLILSIAVHEFGHAIVADRLGDRLPRYEGRVTLNPIAHMDPIGTLALPLFFSLFGGGFVGFGWGKPVRVNPGSFTRKLRMRTAHLLVAAAGPAMNLLFGLLISLIFFGLVQGGVLSPASEVAFAIRNAILLNFILLFLNLVPMHPLDGGTVLVGLLPHRAAQKYESIAKYGMLIVGVVLFSPLNVLFRWPAEMLYTLWVRNVLGL